jgi:acyl-CoA thioester hydrolase
MFFEGGRMDSFTVPIRPRYSEVDGMGIVYHANYLVYFDVGRTEYFRAAGSDYAGLERGGYRLVVVDAGVRYLQPARFDDDLRLSVELAELQRVSLTFRYTLRDLAGTILATGHTRLGCLDTQHRPVRLPPATVACLQRGSPRASPPSESR